MDGDGTSRMRTSMLFITTAGEAFIGSDGSEAIASGGPNAWAAMDCGYAGLVCMVFVGVICGVRHGFV